MAISLCPGLLETKIINHLFLLIPTPWSLILKVGNNGNVKCDVF